MAPEEDDVETTVDVTIQIDTKTARALESPARREAAARYPSFILRDGHGAKVLSEAINDAKPEAGAHGLTDDDIDAEIEEWMAERLP